MKPISETNPELDRLLTWYYKEARPAGARLNLSRKANYNIGRNERCLCGSGKKYKHCCLKGI